MNGFKKQTSVNVENKDIISQFSPHIITTFSNIPLITEGLIAYWKPSMNVVTAAGLVVSWTDLIGGYKLITPASANIRMTYNLTRNIGTPGAFISYGSTTKYLYCNEFIDIGTNLGWTLIAIYSNGGVQMMATPQIGKMVIQGNALNQAGDYGLQPSSSNTVTNKSAHFYDSSLKSTAALTAPTGTITLHALTIDRINGLLTNYVRTRVIDSNNSIAIDVNNNNLVSSNPFLIGYSQGSSISNAVNLYDILVYNRTLSPIEIKNIYRHFTTINGV